MVNVEGREDPVPLFESKVLPLDAVGEDDDPESTLLGPLTRLEL